MYVVDLAERGEFGEGACKIRADPSTTRRGEKRRLVNTGQAKNISSSSADAVPRELRQRPCPAEGHVSSVFKCHLISDGERQQALDAYWGQGIREGRWAYEAQSVRSVSTTMFNTFLLLQSYHCQYVCFCFPKLVCMYRFYFKSTAS